MLRHFEEPQTSKFAVWLVKRNKPGTQTCNRTLRILRIPRSALVLQVIDDKK